MSSPDSTRTAPCPTCEQPALWAYEPLVEGWLCYCLCQGPTLAWLPADPPGPTGVTGAPTGEPPAPPLGAGGTEAKLADGLALRATSGGRDAHATQ